jgi:shikimate dehydrogenase
MIIDQYTALYGVVGFPLKHSLSPVMHNAAFLAIGLNAVYLAFETRDLEGCLQGMKALGIHGMSVTIPYKSAIISWLDEVDGMAKRIGAVNTVVNQEGRLIGHNTDATGAFKALKEKIDPSGKSCLIIGAGGAARAIGFILKEQGAVLTVANHSVKRGEDLAKSLECPFVPLEQMSDVRADLLVQTTPVGMYPRDDECLIPGEALKQGMVVMDIIYNPLETKLLRAARDRGCLTINGLDMFIHQGAEQFMLWTGIEAPLSVMTHAVREALTKGL